MKLSKALEGLCRRLHKALYKGLWGTMRLYKALPGSTRNSISDYEVLSGTKSLIRLYKAIRRL